MGPLSVFSVIAKLSLLCWFQKTSARLSPLVVSSSARARFFRNSLACSCFNRALLKNNSKQTLHLKNCILKKNSFSPGNFKMENFPLPCFGSFSYICFFKATIRFQIFKSFWTIVVDLGCLQSFEYLYIFSGKVYTYKLNHLLH